MILPNIVRGDAVCSKTLLRQNFAARSHASWQLGYPDAALTDDEQAVRNAREIGHAATLMYALMFTSYPHIYRGNYATATEQLDELVALADEKGALFWKTTGMLIKGAVLALTGRAASAVQMITSGITALRSTGASSTLPFYLSCLATAYAELGQFDDAWRCVGEAMTAVETTKERLWEAEVHLIAGEIALEIAAAGCGESRSVFRACARGCAGAAGKILGTARGDAHGAALARSRQDAASARATRPGLRLVHRRLRHARSETG